MQFKLRPASYLASLPAVWELVRRLLDWGGYIDSISAHLIEPGWVGEMIGFLINPPAWSIYPVILIAALFIWLDLRGARLITFGYALGLVAFLIAATVMGWKLYQSLQPLRTNVASPADSQPPNSPYQARSGSVGIRIEGGSGAIFKDNYFGAGIQTGVDAKNTDNLSATGNVFDPNGDRMKLPVRLPQQSNITARYGDISKISRDKLVEIGKSIAADLISFESRYHAKLAGVNKSSSSTALDREAEWAEERKLFAEFTQEYREQFLPDVRSVYGEVAFRFIRQDIQPPAPGILLFVMNGVLAGAHPISDLATFISDSSTKLPD